MLAWLRLSTPRHSPHQVQSGKARPLDHAFRDHVARELDVAGVERFNSGMTPAARMSRAISVRISGVLIIAV